MKVETEEQTSDLLGKKVLFYLSFNICTVKCQQQTSSLTV